MKLFDVYSLFDIEPVKGRGCYVYTADGTEYLDFYGGHAVISIGHSHAKYLWAVSHQVSRLGFYSNSVKNSLQERYAEKLGALSGYDDYSLFLCNSGAEANENAIKLASFHTGRDRVLALRGAFHGRTAGAVSVTDNPSIIAPYNLSGKVDFVNMDNAEAARAMLASGQYAAVIMEGIQGVSGIHEPSASFIKEVSDAAHDNGTLVILDEVQSGFGRTGRFFAHQWVDGLKPDIITCAKGIANGFPMAAVLISPDVPARKGMLGTTFGGNHLACAAALAVLEVIEEERLMENAAEVGAYLMDALRDIPGVKEVRGRGLMIGVEIEGSAPEFRKKLLFDGRVFTGGAGQHTVRLLPALSVTRADADKFITQFSKTLTEFA
ncbi:MAG: aminotransferase class III-fold pyridoxal phosphate-dependent enzyme [Muribaculaceae bacterium]|nr:aminotransferase class III-fold pyridoxal phosphate-dependent enzyme [Muribaculaceae bacterium]